MQWSKRIEIWTGCTLSIVFWKSKIMFSKKLCKEGLISIIMHNLCPFCTFSTFAQKFLKGWGCNFTSSFSKVMCIKSLKMVFVPRIVRHELCMIYASFDFFVRKSFFIKNYFLTADINLTSPGPFYQSHNFCYEIWNLHWSKHFKTKDFPDLRQSRQVLIQAALIKYSRWFLVIKYSGKELQVSW